MGGNVSYGETGGGVLGPMRTSGPNVNPPAIETPPTDTLAAFVGDAAALGIPRESIHVDLSAQTKLYGYDLADDGNITGPTIVSQIKR